MNHEYEWEGPLFDDGYNYQHYPHQDSSSPPSTLTRTPADYCLSAYQAPIFQGLPLMSDFSAPITFNWVDYYAGKFVFGHGQDGGALGCLKLTGPSFLPTPRYPLPFVVPGRPFLPATSILPTRLSHSSHETARDTKSTDPSLSMFRPKRHQRYRRLSSSPRAQPLVYRTSPVEKHCCSHGWRE
jgi:hypothetical protein